MNHITKGFLLAAVLWCLVLVPVVPASAQLAPPIAMTVTGALSATGSVTMPVTSEVAAVAWQITGTFSATVTFEGTVDGVNWVAIAVVPPASTNTRVTTATAAGLWQMNVSGYLSVRARCSAYTSGTITITARRSRTPIPQGV